MSQEQVARNLTEGTTVEFVKERKVETQSGKVDINILMDRVRAEKKKEKGDFDLLHGMCLQKLGVRKFARLALFLDRLYAVYVDNIVSTILRAVPRPAVVGVAGKVKPAGLPLLRLRTVGLSSRRWKSQTLPFTAPVADVDQAARNLSLLHLLDLHLGHFSIVFEATFPLFVGVNRLDLAHHDVSGDFLQLIF